MIRNLRTLFLVAVLAVPSFSAPARANDDFKKFLGALAVMGVLGVIADKNRDRPAAVPVKPAPAPIYTQNYPHNHQWSDNRKQLPQSCYQTFPTAAGKKSYFVQDCLNKHFKHARDLPQRCEIKVEGPGHGYGHGHGHGHGKWKGNGRWKENGKWKSKHKDHKVYSPNCLQQYGYYIQRRER